MTTTRRNTVYSHIILLTTETPGSTINPQLRIVKHPIKLQVSRTVSNYRTHKFNGIPTVGWKCAYYDLIAATLAYAEYGRQ